MMALWTLATAALADPHVDVLEGAIARHLTALHLPDAPRIYHLRYRLFQLEGVSAEVHAGEVVLSEPFVQNQIGVEVRVGSPSFDNTGFGGWQDGFESASLPAELTPHALDLAAWRLTDRAYKAAVEHHARKTAQWTPPADHPGDYTLTDPIRDEGAAPTVPDQDALVALAVAASAAVGLHPALLNTSAHLGAEAGTEWIVDSEGTAGRRAVSEVSLRVAASVRADDGMLLTDQRLWTASSLKGLPPQDAIAASAAAMGQDLLARAAHAPLANEYVGPVRFDGAAAVDLFRALLVDQVEGTPSEIPFETWLGDIGEAGAAVRLGRRVLPSGWHVVDDASLRPDMPFAGPYDAEGRRIEPVTLVEDGIVRDLLMTRTPRNGVDGNGHARGWPGTAPRARVHHLVVTPPRRASPRALHLAAVRAAKAYGEDRYLLIRRLEEPAIPPLTDPDRAGASEVLPRPVDAVWVDARGNQTPVRNLAFAGVVRWVLRDILAAGADVQSTWMAPFAGDSATMGPTEGLATSARVPAIVVGEMELVPLTSDPADKPRILP